MFIAYTLRGSTRPRKDPSEPISSPIEPPTARDAGYPGVDESSKNLQLEQAVRQATAQLRRSVKLSNSLDDGLHSLVSSRHVSPSLQRFLVPRVSRYHQRN